MSLTHAMRLLATGAVSTAVAVGGLATIPQTANAVSARAAQASTSYTCNFGSNGTRSIPVSFALPNMPTTALAGVPIAAQPVIASLSLPPGLPGLLVGAGGSLGATVDNLLMTVGYGAIPVSLAGPTSRVVSTGDGATLVVGGNLGTITPGAPGDMPIAFPSSFDLGLLKGTSTPLGSFTCSAPAASKAGTVQVSKQTSKMDGKVVGKAKSNKGAQIQVAVQRQVGVPLGRVSATLKGHKIGGAKLRHGQAVLQLQKLGVGVWKVKLSYTGDSATNAAHKTVTVHVTR
jgi:hypothetical protein